MNPKQYNEYLAEALADGNPLKLKDGTPVFYIANLANRDGVKVYLLTHNLTQAQRDEARKALHNKHDVTGFETISLAPPYANSPESIYPLNKFNLALSPHRLWVGMREPRLGGGAFWQIRYGGYTFAIHACEDCFEALSYWLTLPKDNDTQETMGEMIADDQGAQALEEIRELIYWHQLPNENDK